VSLPDIRITRYMLDGTRCGMAQGRHAAWNWAYRVHCDGVYCGGGCGSGKSHDIGRGLRTARDVARDFALKSSATWVREDWEGGKTFVIGPRGGLIAKEQSPTSAADFARRAA
jgi:hypothetical protein